VPENKTLLLLYFGFMSFFGEAQDFFHKDSITILADSLHNVEAYEEALIMRKRALEHVDNYTKDYQAYLWSKYYHTRACISEYRSYDYYNPKDSISRPEREQLLLNAINHIEKARVAYAPATKKDKRYLYDLQNRIYHEKGYLGQWEDALKEANLGYRILKDTLGEKDKKIVDLIYDIGYINGKLGRYNEAAKYYQKSLELYEKILQSPHTDIAQAYLNIAQEYKKMGFRSNELNALLKARDIWEQLQNSDDNGYLYRCYGSLFQWYLNYGDIEAAQHVLQKRQKLFKQESTAKLSFIRNHEEEYHENLSQSIDRISLRLKQGDSLASLKEIDSLLDRIPTQGKMRFKFEAEYKSRAWQEYAGLMKKEYPIKALAAMDSAIAIATLSRFQLDPYPFFTTKARLLVEQEKWEEASFFLEKLIPTIKGKERAELFPLYILNGKTLQALEHMNEAENNFQNALSEACLPNVSIAGHVSYKDLKPLISFETVEGFMAMGDFYFGRYQKGKDNHDLKTGLERYFLASQLFHNLYLGDRYNKQLFKTYTSLMARLLECAHVLSIKESPLIAQIVNESENNASRLTWSRFMFSQHANKMGLPKSILEQESDLRSQLEFYFSKRYAFPFEKDSTKTSLWEKNIDSLKWEQRKLMETIKKDYAGYYTLLFHDFDITSLQNELKGNTIILKYLYTQDELFLFEIGKNHIITHLLGKKPLLDTHIKTFLDALQNRDHLPSDLQKALLPESIPKNVEHMVIIPDGLLSYLPFEVLFELDQMPAISYAPSLILYQAQMAVKKNNPKNKMGAFSSSKTLSQLRTLPYAEKEISQILKYFPGDKHTHAGKENFSKEAPNYDLLHIATHSSVDIDPDRSALFFGEEKLFASEIYNKHLNAKMAVLSSCDTGSGSFENGEGIMSLARAFTYAGVPATVMGLWQVDDRATAMLMEYFYKHLKEGQTKDVALKNAKLDYLHTIKDPLLRHPYYWAGFVVTGNTDAITENTAIPWWWIVSLFFLLGSLWAWKRFGNAGH
jgi:hypothetical protein